ncbi:hypothetical protein JCM8202_003498 [Rhodotorula sphaerocarpa]
MVCAKCEKKIAKQGTLAATDVWKGAGQDKQQRKIGENKLLSSKARYSPYAPPTAGSSKASASEIPYGERKRAAKAAAAGKDPAPVDVAGGKGGAVGRCEVCRSVVARPGARYCQGCAYKKGACAMCGKEILDTKMYKQTTR